MLSDASVSRLAAMAGSPSESLVTSQRSFHLGPDGANGFENEKRLFAFDRYYLEVTPEVAMEQLTLTDDQVLTEPPLQREPLWTLYISLMTLC